MGWKMMKGQISLGIGTILIVITGHSFFGDYWGELETILLVIFSVCVIILDKIICNILAKNIKFHFRMLKPINPNYSQLEVCLGMGVNNVWINRLFKECFVEIKTELGIVGEKRIMKKDIVEKDGYFLISNNKKKSDLLKDTIHVYTTDLVTSITRKKEKEPIEIPVISFVLNNPKKIVLLGAKKVIFEGSIDFTTLFGEITKQIDLEIFFPMGFK